MELISKFLPKRSNTTSKIESLLDDIATALKENDVNYAKNRYSKVMKLYRKLDPKLKKAIIDKCMEVRKHILSFNISQPESAAPTIKKPDDGSDDVVEYIKTGISGFDDLIENGIIKGSNILVSGGPGSGKTTFTSQLLVNNAVQGKKCLYMSFEESVVRLRRHLRQYGYDPTKLENEGTLVLKRYDPFMISRSVEALLAQARGELVIEIDKTKKLIPEDFVPDIVVVDSLSAIAAAFAGKDEAYRIYVEQLFRSFEDLGVTSFLITECDGDSGKLSKTGVEEFLADGVIAFYNKQMGNTRINAIEVFKMRGTSHKKKIVPFSFISGKGIEVYPLQEIIAE